MGESLGGDSGTRLTYALIEVEAGGGFVDHGNFVVSPQASRATGASERLDALSAAEETTLDTDRFSALVRPVDELSRQRVEDFAKERAVTAFDLLRSRLQSASSSDGAATRALRLRIDRDGVYRLSVEQLSEAFDLNATTVRRGLDRGRLDLQHHGRQVAWWSDADNLFFWGELDEEDVYSNTATYWLSPGNGLKARQRQANSRPSGRRQLAVANARFERNLFAGTAASLDAEEDFWFWNVLAAGHPTVGTRNYDFDLTMPSDVGRAEITLRIFGATDEPTPLDHSIVVVLNGVEVGSHQWSGVGSETLNLEFNASLLLASGNTLSLTSQLPSGASASVLYMNDFTLQYPRELEVISELLEIESAGGAVRLTGFDSVPAVLDISRSDRPEVLAGVHHQRGSTDFDPGVGSYRIVAYAETAPRAPVVRNRDRCGRPA